MKFLYLTRLVACRQFLHGSLVAAKRNGRRSVDSGEHHARARELRQVAETTRDQNVRAELLALTDRYDRLAARAEDQERKTQLRSASLSSIA